MVSEAEHRRFRLAGGAARLLWHMRRGPARRARRRVVAAKPFALAALPLAGAGGVLLAGGRCRRLAGSVRRRVPRGSAPACGVGAWPRLLVARLA
jgi:hypothetical protein